MWRVSAVAFQSVHFNGGQTAIATGGSLAEDEHAEKEDPEDAHGVPIPGSTVDYDLSQLDTTEEDQGQHRAAESGDAKQQVQTVGSGDEVEEVATRVGGKEDALRHQLFPRNPLPGEKQCAQKDSCGQPGSGAADRGTA